MVIDVVDVHDEVCAALFGEAASFVVDEAGVLDGIDTGEDCVLDAFSAVCVGGDFASGHVGGFGGDFEFFERVLRRAGAIAFGKHSAGSENLDDVDAVFYLRANDVAQLVVPVGNLEVTLFGKHGDAGLRRKAVQVAVASGDRDRKRT